jgi:transposase-like protein
VRPWLLRRAISAINLKLDQGLAEFARRRLDEACPYLILDARYVRVRVAAVIHSQAVLLGDRHQMAGRRHLLAVEPANRESRSSWRDFLMQLRERRTSVLGILGPAVLALPSWSGSFCLRRQTHACRTRGTSGTFSQLGNVPGIINFGSVLYVGQNTRQ